MVIDNLAESPPNPGFKISNYSTVSKKWVKRTQQHHFRELRFAGRGHLRKWSENSISDLSGVSRYVRKLSWVSIDTLEGFENCIQAFTGATAATFDCCNCFRSLDRVRPLTSLGSILVDLHIEMDVKCTDPPPEVILWFLAALPHLRHFHAKNLVTGPPRNPKASLPTIPFFEGENHFELSFGKGYPDIFWWIPETARFGKLTLGVSFLATRTKVNIVNEWIASSGRSLKGLYFKYDGFPGRACICGSKFSASPADFASR